ncbi:MAG: hypothetical protein KAH44_18700 [Oricola sp.]|jgi:hypothetical protein|nr:hypothetical protein [Oricola sp.]
MNLSWEIFYVIGTVLLAGGIAWATLKSKRVSRREREISEQATHEMYKHPGAYEDHEREELEEAAEREAERQDKAKR